MTEPALASPNKFHDEIMNFLRDASKENPLDLHTAFLGNKKSHDTYYPAYHDLSRLKYIAEDNNGGAWLTNLGKQYLELVTAATREKLKAKE